MSEIIASRDPHRKGLVAVQHQKNVYISKVQIEPVVWFTLQFVQCRK
jgi:hypothetical protein